MKKLGLLILPLMAVSFLASCGSNGPQPSETYTITFKNDGDEDKKIESIKAGSIVTDNIPTPSTREGSTFIGWCTDTGSKNVFDFETVKIYQNYTLYSGWKVTPGPDPEVSYHFTFNGTDCTVNGKNEFEMDILTGAKTQFEIVPKAGQKLPENIGIEEGENVTYNSLNGIVSISNMTSDVVINATSLPYDRHYLTLNCTGCTINSKRSQLLTIGENETLTFTIVADKGYNMPQSVVVTKYGSFTEYKDGCLTVYGAFGDTELSITSKRSDCYVHFDGVGANIWEGTTNLGSNYSKKYAIETNLSFLVKPTDTFNYLSEDISFKVDGEAASPTTYEKQTDGSYKLVFAVTGDIDILVHSYNAYTIKFVTNCGTTLDDAYVLEGWKLTKPTITNGNHYLIGWYDDEAMTHKYDFSLNVYEDMTLYADWTVGSSVDTPFTIVADMPIASGIVFRATNNSESIINPLIRKISYKVNGGEWQDLEINEWNVEPGSSRYRFFPDLQKGDRLSIMGDYPNGFTGEDGVTVSLVTSGEGLLSLEGNIMSLIGGNSFASLTTIPCDGCFENMFETFKLRDASGLLLPATTLKSDCYNGMFANTNVIYGPEVLPAEYVPYGAYSAMFSNCYNLVESPDIYASPSIILSSSNAMSHMFLNCLSLKKIKTYFVRSGWDAEATTDWVTGVPSSGTFVWNDYAIYVDPSYFNVNQIPPGWDVVSRLY